MSAERLLKYLQSKKDDRGSMANLRCGLVDGKQHRAWPYLGHLNGIGDEHDHASRVIQTIAGLYATHPEESSNGDLGSLCRKLLGDEERSKLATAEGVGPISRRFQHLLVADADEVFDRVLRFILRAKADNIPVNYMQLYKDLLDWKYKSDRVRVRWARSFWAPETESAE